MMKSLAILSAIVLLCACTRAQPPRKVVFVIVDGIPADVMERLHPPTLQAISGAGGYARASVGGEVKGYSETPTISAVGYNSLLTGTWVNKHNVWDNDIAAPNYHYPTIFHFLKKQFPAKKTAVFSTWLDNRTKLIGSEAKEAGNLQPDFHFDGWELDTIRFPHDTAGRFYHHIDNAVANEAAKVIRSDAPDLSWVYLEYPDEMGHRHGNSAFLDTAVMEADRQLSVIWQALQYRMQQFGEDWQIWITTDHGREDNGYHHGGQSPRERGTWIATNAKGLNDRFHSGRASIVDIMPSMAQFLSITIPKAQAMEIDGISLTGAVCAEDLLATYNNGHIGLTWKAGIGKGAATIWLASGNLAKTGGMDRWRMMKKVNLEDGKASIDVPKQPSSFYKIVLETPCGYRNRWVLPVQR